MLKKGSVTGALKRALPLESGQRTFVRDIHGRTLLENFLVSAVASVLIIRLYLHLTGYPEIGGGGLHIAHIVWGGLFMMVALFILLGFLSRASREAAAVIGGIGFGAFIDELGKFVTADNDYFFKPAPALIYLTFVLLFLSIRGLQRLNAPSKREYLANAFEIAKQGVIDDLDPESRQRALGYLQKCDPADPLVDGLREVLLGINGVPSTRPNILTRSRRLARSLYQRLVQKWWFTRAVVGVFVFKSLTNLYQMVALLEWSWALGLWLAGGVLLLLLLLRSRRTRISYLQMPLAVAMVAVAILMTWAVVVNLRGAELSFVDWGQLISPSISGVLVVMGILLIGRSRLEAYLMFQRAVLISILLTQVFAFYENQFVAVAGLLIDVVILLTLRYMISQEQANTDERDHPMWRDWLGAIRRRMNRLSRQPAHS